MNRSASAALILVLATLLGLMSGWQMHQTHGRPFTAPWIALNLSYFYGLALLLPGIRTFARRHRPDVHSAVALTLGHAAAFAACWAAYSALLACVRHALGVADNLLLVTWWRYFVWAVDWILVVYGATVLGTWAVEFGREADERSVAAAMLEADLSNVQLGAMRAQLDPDVLYSRFVEIASLVDSDPDAAEARLQEEASALRCALAAHGTRRVEVRHPARSHR